MITENISVFSVVIDHINAEEWVETLIISEK